MPDETKRPDPEPPPMPGGMAAGPPPQEDFVVGLKARVSANVAESGKPRGCGLSTSCLMTPATSGTTNGTESALTLNRRTLPD